MQRQQGRRSRLRQKTRMRYCPCLRHLTTRYAIFSLRLSLPLTGLLLLLWFFKDRDSIQVEEHAITMRDLMEYDPLSFQQAEFASRGHAGHRRRRGGRGNTVPPFTPPILSLPSQAPPCPKWLSSPLTCVSSRAACFQCDPLHGRL